MAKKRKAGRRGLADMNAAEPERPWAPELPPDGPPEVVDAYINDKVLCRQKFSEDKYRRLVEWAVIQMRLQDGEWVRVAVYDICHGKGMHVHLYDRAEKEFTQQRIRPIGSYEDSEAGFLYAIDRVTGYWDEQEWRSSGRDKEQGPEEGGDGVSDRPADPIA